MQFIFSHPSLFRPLRFLVCRPVFSFWGYGGGSKFKQSGRAFGLFVAVGLVLLGGGLLFWYHYITSCQSTHAAFGIMSDSLHFVSAAAWQGVIRKREKT